MSVDSTMVASKTPNDNPPKAARKPAARSRVSNGGQLLPGVDGRSLWVRRCRDIIELHLSDLGGLSNTSEAERSIVRRVAVLTTELEMLERKFALAGSAEVDDLDLYQRTAGNLRRLLEAIGLQRRPRDTSLDLQTYLFVKAQSCDAGELREAAE